MSRYDESQHPRSQDGRWRHKSAAAPAASLEDQAPTQTTKRRTPTRPKTGVIRTSLAQLSAPDTIEAVGKGITAVKRQERALRRALVERELQRAGVLVASVGVDADGKADIKNIHAKEGVNISNEALRNMLGCAADHIDGQADDSSYMGLVRPWSGPRWVRVTANDRVDQAQAIYDRAVDRLRSSAAKATTALCLEAERQGVGRLNVEDGSVLIHETGEPLTVEGGKLAELADTEESGLPRYYVQDLPGVDPSEGDDSSWSVDVAEHLASQAQDVQIPGQTYIRV